MESGVSTLINHESIAIVILTLVALALIFAIKVLWAAYTESNTRLHDLQVKTLDALKDIKNMIISAIK